MTLRTRCEINAPSAEDWPAPWVSLRPLLRFDYFASSPNRPFGTVQTGPADKRISLVFHELQDPFGYIVGRDRTDRNLVGTAQGGTDLVSLHKRGANWAGLEIDREFSEIRRCQKVGVFAGP